MHKHLAGIRYEDISLTVDEGIGPGLFDWMRGSLARQWRRRNGAVVTCDYRGTELERLEFSNALLSEVDLPALDAGSKETARMTVKCRPEYTRTRPGTANVVGAGPDKAVQKKWLPSNFRLSIDGLDCTRTSRIEEIPIRLVAVESAVGEMRDHETLPAHWEIPNLVVTIAETNATTWEQWYEAFVIQGNNADPNEKSGTLDYLDSALRSVLFSVRFRGLGIFKFAPDKVEASPGKLRRVKAEMYCEQLEIVPGEFGAGSMLNSGGTPPSRVEASQAAQGLVVPRLRDPGQALTRVPPAS